MGNARFRYVRHIPGVIVELEAPAFGDPSVRRALTLGIDRPTLYRILHSHGFDLWVEEER